jgi:hypothetical protein
MVIQPPFTLPFLISSTMGMMVMVIIIIIIISATTITTVMTTQCAAFLYSRKIIKCSTTFGSSEIRSKIVKISVSEL